MPTLREDTAATRIGRLVHAASTPCEAEWVNVCPATTA
jgi:hypothetical protein